MKKFAYLFTSIVMVVLIGATALSSLGAFDPLYLINAKHVGNSDSVLSTDESPAVKFSIADTTSTKTFVLSTNDSTRGSVIMRVSFLGSFSRWVEFDSFTTVVGLVKTYTVTNDSLKNIWLPDNSTAVASSYLKSMNGWEGIFGFYGKNYGNGANNKLTVIEVR